MATFPDYNPVFLQIKLILLIQEQFNLVTAINKDLLWYKPKAKQWSLTFNVDNEDATEIETFLEARKVDGASFDWSPPDSSTTFKWVCPSFTKEVFSFDRNRINATFYTSI